MIFIIQVALLVIIMLALLFYCLFIFDSILATSRKEYIDVPSSRKSLKNVIGILKELGVSDKNLIFYDLGSGHGKIAIGIKKAFPSFQSYGFDRSIFKIYFSRIRAVLNRTEVHFQRKNILELDLRKADIVFVYIWPSTMEALSKKFREELKPGAFAVISTFPLSEYWQPILTKETLSIKNDHTFEKIYVYRK